MTKNDIRHLFIEIMTNTLNVPRMTAVIKSIAHQEYIVDKFRYYKRKSKTENIKDIMAYTILENCAYFDVERTKDIANLHLLVSLEYIGNVVK